MPQVVSNLETSPHGDDATEIMLESCQNAHGINLPHVAPAAGSDDIARLVLEEVPKVLNYQLLKYRVQYVSERAVLNVSRQCVGSAS